MKKKANIALLSKRPDINEYLIEEVANTKLPIELVEVSDQDLFQTNFDGVIFIETNKRVKKRPEELLELALQAQETGKGVIWVVWGDSNLQARVSTELIGPATINLMDADLPKILDAIISFGETTLEQQLAATNEESVNKNATNGKKSVQVTQERSSTGSDGKRSESLFFKSHQGDNEENDDYLLDDGTDTGSGGLISDLKETASAVISKLRSEPPTIELPESLDNVIAVSGFSGAGVSFVAWNIAACLQRPVVLVEGRTTGALSAWFGRMNDSDLVSRDDFLVDGEATIKNKYLSLALKAELPIRNVDLMALSKVGKTVVVDCGPDFNQDVFRLAKRKVFVVAPNPRYLRQPMPDQKECLWVMNQWPHNSPFQLSYVDQAFNRSFELIVPSKDRQVMLSQWAARAWVELEDEAEVMIPWRKRFEGEIQ